MTLTALVLTLEAGDVDRLSDALLGAGALSVACEEAPPHTAAESYDEPGAIASWPLIELTALCRAQDDPERLLRRACSATGMAMPVHGSYSVPDEDWVAKSREQFAPIRASERLWIVPTWNVPPVPDAVNLVLDPGLAFGTGSHPSTRLCLQWLERTIRGGETVLDYGCGSGILAIAALKLGADRAVGVDIDPDALVAARANARRNRTAVEFFDGRAQLSLMADIVVANILASPLKVLAPLLASHCVRGGWLALGGILSFQAGEMEKCYAPWVRFGARAEAEGWVCLSGMRQ